MLREINYTIFLLLLSSAMMIDSVSVGGARKGNMELEKSYKSTGDEVRTTSFVYIYRVCDMVSICICLHGSLHCTQISFMAYNDTAVYHFAIYMYTKYLNESYISHKALIFSLIL